PPSLLAIGSLLNVWSSCSHRPWLLSTGRTILVLTPTNRPMWRPGPCAPWPPIFASMATGRLRPHRPRKVKDSAVDHIVSALAVMWVGAFTEARLPVILRSDAPSPGLQGGQQTRFPYTRLPARRCPAHAGLAVDTVATKCVQPG